MGQGIERLLGYRCFGYIVSKMTEDGNPALVSWLHGVPRMCALKRMSVKQMDEDNNPALVSGLHGGEAIP